MKIIWYRRGARGGGGRERERERESKTAWYWKEEHYMVVSCRGLKFTTLPSLSSVNKGKLKKPLVVQVFWVFFLTKKNELAFSGINYLYRSP